MFNAAIEHFKFGQIKFILNSLKEVMSNNSFIFAYTLVEDKKKPNYLLEHHEMFFDDQFELERIFKKHFKKIRSFKTLVNGRSYIYLAASDNKDINF